MKRKAIILLVAGSLLITGCCSSKQNTDFIVNGSEVKNNIFKDIGSFEKKEADSSALIMKNINNINNINNRYKSISPKQWGEKVDGVITRIDTKSKIIALTFDACGSKDGSGYDSKLISYLIKENVPATLFINSRWIDANQSVFLELSRNPLFEIENHGYLHKPLSMNGRSAYNIKGTENTDEIIEEVYLNELKIQRLTGRKPKYFRSGTAYYDEVSVGLVKELGEKPVGFSIIGDAGATFSSEQIKKVSLTAKEGSIIIYHMNHPEKETAKGIAKSIPVLKEKGFKFVKLEEYDQLLK